MKSKKKTKNRKEKTMENVVIYARFSSHNQTEASIEGQLQVCYEYAKRNNYKVVQEYIDRAIFRIIIMSNNIIVKKDMSSIFNKKSYKK